VACSWWRPDGVLLVACSWWRARYLAAARPRVRRRDVVRPTGLPHSFAATSAAPKGECQLRPTGLFVRGTSRALRVCAPERKRSRGRRRPQAHECAWIVPTDSSQTRPCQNPTSRHHVHHVHHGTSAPATAIGPARARMLATGNDHGAPDATVRSHRLGRRRSDPGDLRALNEGDR
jgi:hypothetical protein